MSITLDNYSKYPQFRKHVDKESLFNVVLLIVTSSASLDHLRLIKQATRP